MEILPRSERRRIGLIAGSGPEAGADLWTKIISASKALLGENYEGDIDAPNVRIVSSPILGLSMELQKFDIALWPEVERTFDELAEQVDFISIACNTLNYYERQIRSKPRKATLVTVSEVVESYLRTKGEKEVALLGACPVTKLDKWSAYVHLRKSFDVEIPADTAELHKLIYGVKKLGGSNTEIVRNFEDFLCTLKAETVLLACTELPLIPVLPSHRDMVDVTELLAQQLVQNAYQCDPIQTLM